MVLKRGVAAGRSAQRACERSSDWRRGAAGSPDPYESQATVRLKATQLPDPYCAWFYSPVVIARSPGRP